MDITRAAIEKNRITFILLAVIYAGGLGAYVNAPRAFDPGFTIRTATVITRFPGASPERVENLVTDKIEKVVQEMPELDDVVSESKTGVSIVYVNIQESYAEMRPIWDSLRRKVDDARTELPDEVIGPFVNDEFGDVFGIILAINGEGYSYREIEDVAEAVRDEILRLPDSAKVEIHGAQQERIFVEYSDTRLSEYGLSTLYLRQVLEARNIIIPGGDITTGIERIVLEPSGSFDSIDDLKRTVVSLPGRNELVYLEDIADVYRDYVDPPSAKMKANGIPCLGLAISMREGGNLIELGRQVQELVDRLPQQFPIGVDFELMAFEPRIVEKRVDDFVLNILQAIAIVMLFMLAMLGLRTGLIVASLIPSAMVMSLLIMSFFDIGLNQISLASLIISLGLLVDNAIVMAESIMVLMAAGTKPIEAAVKASRELRIPLLTSSLTTSAAFLPIYLAESTVGEYTSALFEVVTITLLSSWVLAFTVVPMLCVLFLKVRLRRQDFSSLVYRSYRGLLLRLLRFRSLTALATVGVFALAIAGLSRVPQIFFPPSDTPRFYAELELPIGTAIERTEEIMFRIDEFVDSELLAGLDGSPGVINWSGYVGRGAPRYTLAYSPEPESPEYAFMIFNTTSRAAVDDVILRLEAFCLENFPDLKATIKALSNGPIIDNPVEVRLSGPDTDTLYNIADQVKAQLRTIPGTKNIDDDWGQRTKKFVVRIDEERARRSGVTNHDVAVSLQTVLSGFRTTDFREEDDIIPVTLRSVEADRSDLGKLESLNVASQTTGDSVPLKQVADIEVVFEPAKIFRRDRLRTITVASDHVGAVTPAQVTNQLLPWLETNARQWGFGYRFELGGEFETSGEGNTSIVEKLPIALLIILLLMVSQFNSLRRAGIVLLTIPLGLIGVTVGLLVMDSYFGFMTLLGIISLAGIVINNAIVLIDRIRIEIESNGLEPARAVIEAAQTRLRPILLTTATTIGGLIPLYFGGGIIFESMAITIIFGLLFATVLTLGIVPALYAIFFRVSFRGFTY